jgi:HPt (histidine-containing phosphotransfer) domain-containing protein
MTTEIDDRPIYSTLAQDPDLSELIDLYVQEMPQKLEQLSRLLAEADVPGVGRLAHQLKGAAGSHGFHEITPYAVRLEHAAREQGDLDQIRAAAEELVGICRRIRSGGPG